MKTLKLGDKFLQILHIIIEYNRISRVWKAGECVICRIS